MSFNNIVETIEKMDFFNALKNTGIITVGGLILVILFGSIAGFALARINRKGFRIYYGALIALMVVPFIGVLISLIRLTVTLHLYNTLWAGILITSGMEPSVCCIPVYGVYKGLAQRAGGSGICRRVFYVQGLLQTYSCHCLLPLQQRAPYVQV